MRETKIGNLELRAEGRSVRFSLAANAGVAVTLDQQRLRELIRFAQLALQSDLNQRQAERLNVPDDCGISARLWIKDHQVPARILDLSLTGAQIVLSEDTFRPLFIHETLRLELTLHDEHVVLDARVVRQSGATYGIHFPDCQRDGALCPPPELARIVHRLVPPASKPRA